MCKREGDKETEADKDTALLIHKFFFFSSPYHAVLSSGLYIFASFISRPGATAGRYPNGRLAASLCDWP